MGALFAWFMVAYGMMTCSSALRMVILLQMFISGVVNVDPQYNTKLASLWDFAGDYSHSTWNMNGQWQQTVCTATRNENFPHNKKVKLGAISFTFAQTVNASCHVYAYGIGEKTPDKIDTV